MDGAIETRPLSWLSLVSQMSRIPNWKMVCCVLFSTFADPADRVVTNMMHITLTLGG